MNEDFPSAVTTAETENDIISANWLNIFKENYKVIGGQIISLTNNAVNDIVGWRSSTVIFKFPQHVTDSKRNAGIAQSNNRTTIIIISRLVSHILKHVLSTNKIISPISWLL